MDSFVCPLCLNERDFPTFSKFFRHITVYHQTDSRFRIVCDLSPTCGTLYRTFSAYKAHVYRHHQSALRPVRQNTNVNQANNNDQELEQTKHSIDEDSDESIDVEFEYQRESDSEDEKMAAAWEHRSKQHNSENPMRSVIESFVLFVLQLREEFFLPKSTMNAITDYIIMLIESIQTLLKRQAGNHSSNDSLPHTTTAETSRRVIALELVDSVMGDVCQQLQRISKNEYQFVRCCRELFGYEPPVEIIVNDASDSDGCETAYFIPIERTLSRILHDDHILSLMMCDIEQQRRSTTRDEDLMFSFRDGHFGSRIDDDSLLVQLYLDDIGVTNPLGAKKDAHKLTMFYFSLEDLPDQYRSKLDFIQLMAMCDSRMLKVRFS